jgi:Curli production assembly/transport component CsgG.
MQKPIVVLFFLFCSIASAADLIAVNNLKATGVTENEALSLTDALRSELGKSGKYQVMERSQMDEILKEQGFQRSGACDEASCAIEMGKILAVNYMVMGNIGMVGKTYTLSVRFVEVGTGRILKDFTEYHKGTADELLTRVVPMLSQKIAGSYQSRKNSTGWWIAGGVAVAAAIAVPAVLLSRKPTENGPTSSDIVIHW